MDSDVLRTLKAKLVQAVTWVVLSIVLTQLMTLFTESNGNLFMLGDTSPHEATIRSCMVRPQDIDTTMADVGGLRRSKEEIMLSIVLPLTYPTTFFQKSGPFATSRGVLLTGPPGCGKTLLAKALAKQTKAHFIPLEMSTLFNKYFGESSKLLAAAFSLCRKLGPTILFIDEIDGAFKARADSDSQCEYSLKTELLTHLDGLKSHRSDDRFLVIAATNHPDSLDAALRRRFPVTIAIDPPDHEERCEIVGILCRQESAQALHAFRKLAPQMTVGFTGSDLAELYRTTSRLRLKSAMRTTSTTKMTPAKVRTGGGTGGGTGINALALPALDESVWRAAILQMRPASCVKASTNNEEEVNDQQEKKKKAATSLRHMLTKLSSSLA